MEKPDGLASNDFLFFFRNKAEDDEDDDPADRESLGVLKAAGWAGIEGTWNIDDGGIATLSLQIAGADGNEFKLQIRHELLDADTMRITIQLPQPFPIELVRVKD